MEARCVRLGEENERLKRERSEERGRERREREESVRDAKVRVEGLLASVRPFLSPLF